MYLQITTKCNMLCPHCCYSCNRNGRHADWMVLVDAVAFAWERTDSISIGGGEPTLHPQFFNLLRICLNDFDFVWMATNGSRTKTMRRLYDILNDEDYDSDEPIYAPGKLAVALSLDPFHDPIDENIKRLWKNAAEKHKHTGFEIRNATQFGMDRVIGQGRAKRNGYTRVGCVCPYVIIKPDGKLRMCGCTNAPIIGDVFNGIDDKWNEYMSENREFLDTNCFNGN